MRWSEPFLPRVFSSDRASGCFPVSPRRPAADRLSSPASPPGLKAQSLRGAAPPDVSSPVEKSGGYADRDESCSRPGEAIPITVTRERAGLAGLSAAWDELAAHSGSPMQQYAWIHACADTFVQEGDLSIFAAGTAPRITAIAPLIRRGGGARLELPAADEMYEPMDFLYADAASLAPVTNALARTKLPILLRRIPAESPVIGALRRSYRGGGAVICRPVAGCPWIALDSTWVRPEDKLNPGRRSDLRRARRIAERFGPVSSEVLSPDPKAVGPLLDEAFRVELASWKGSQGTALASDTTRGRFCRRYAVAACERGILRVCFLRIGERAAAMQLAVECGGRFWLLKIGYDQAFHRCSPGLLLVRETVQYAAECGLHGYEFLGIDEPWTRIWTREVHRCVSVWACPVLWRALAPLGFDLVRQAWRRLRLEMGIGR